MAYLPQKRLRLLILTACLALTAVLAEAFIFTSLDHDCCGHGCPVCVQIQAAQSLLEGVGRIAAGALFAGVCVLGAKSTALLADARPYCPLTPVALKIKRSC